MDTVVIVLILVVLFLAYSYDKKDNSNPPAQQECTPGEQVRCPDNWVIQPGKAGVVNKAYKQCGPDGKWVTDGTTYGPNHCVVECNAESDGYVPCAADGECYVPGKGTCPG